MYGSPWRTADGPARIRLTPRGSLSWGISASSQTWSYGLYCDNGRTGTNFDRPGFAQMMEDVRTGKIDCIVVKDLSRFGRNYKETSNYLERIFPVLDVRFVAVNDSFDTLTTERSDEGYIIPLKNIIKDTYHWEKKFPILANNAFNLEGCLKCVLVSFHQPNKAVEYFDILPALAVHSGAFTNLNVVD